MQPVRYETLPYSTGPILRVMHVKKNNYWHHIYKIILFNLFLYLPKFSLLCLSWFWCECLLQKPHPSLPHPLPRSNQVLFVFHFLSFFLMNCGYAFILLEKFFFSLNYPVNFKIELGLLVFVFSLQILNIFRSLILGFSSIWELD